MVGEQILVSSLKFANRTHYLFLIYQQSVHSGEFTEADICLTAVRALFVEGQLAVQAQLAVKLVAVFVQAPDRIANRVVADQAF